MKFLKLNLSEQRKWQLNAVLTVVSFVLLYLLLKRNLVYTIIFAVSMVGHEIGHAIQLMANGIRVIILFIPFLGAAMKPANKIENKKADALPWEEMAQMLLSGPAINILFVALGIILAMEGFVQEGLFLASVNLMLAHFNLLPIFPLDGGQFVKVIFSSLDETRDRVLTILAAVVLLVANIQLLQAGKFDFYPFIVLAGVFWASTHDNPSYSKSKQAISASKAYLWMAVYWAMSIGVLVANYLFNIPNFVELLK